VQAGSRSETDGQSIIDALPWQMDLQCAIVAPCLQGSGRIQRVFVVAHLPQYSGSDTGKVPAP
jgi:hypothetical protein